MPRLCGAFFHFSWPLPSSNAGIYLPVNQNKPSQKDLPCGIGSSGMAYVPKDLGQEHIGRGKLLYHWGGMP